MKCPRCRVAMARGKLDAAGVDIEALNCKECTGHWINLEVLRALETVTDVRLVKWRHLPGIETQGRILFCPSCPGEKPMDKIVSDRDQRVVMDHCLNCNGVWLDYGELEAIQRKGLLSALADIVAFIRK